MLARPIVALLGFLLGVGPVAAQQAPPPADARVLCEQPVVVHLARPASVAERYRRFVGVWSDAAWSPTQCAALVVENVSAGGNATIVYAFGPMTPDPGAPGGVLHGTGVVRDGELRFQNADGSQFAFRPSYADLQGQLVTAQGQSYQAVFKNAP